MTAKRAQEILSHLAQLGANPTGISADSRKLVVGDVFAAWAGAATDGRRHIPDALSRGAAAILWESGDGHREQGLPVPGVGVEGLRDLAGHLAHEIHGRPSEQLWVAGVTGTNGKTTVSQWIAMALAELGQRCAVVGTLGCGYPGALEEALNTTPDATELHRRMSGFVADRADALAMEVSSIGLDQGRVNGVAFDVAVFTNLSRDHLDYHPDMTAYAQAKARLFQMPGLRHAVINLDDSFGLEQARRVLESGIDLIGYSIAGETAVTIPGARQLTAIRVGNAPVGMRFSVSWNGREADVQVGMIAPFNVSNLLAVIGALLARGVDFDDALRVVSRLAPPKGRMELLGGVGEPLIVIDYAHSPDALAKVLDAVGDTVRTRGGELVCVFGCGGDRDPGKRPLMGEIAADKSDRVIVTSDNPRSEDPAAIIRDILAGIGAGADAIADRASAIAIAIAEAGPNDVVVIAGKGHESYQEIHGRRLPFSDREQARKALAAWNRAQGGQS